MVRMLSILAAASVMLAGTTPAFAQTPVYRAVPATPVQTAQNVIVGDLLWKCGPDGCTTSTASSRPAIVCAQAARKVGKLGSFTVNNVAFDADALSKCNAKAKG
jgi:hypothetical protein